MNHIELNILNQERVAVMTLDYQRENRFNPAMLEEMMAALDQIEKDDGVGALVVTGRDPKFFCNGLDLDWLMARIGEPETIANYLSQVNAMFKRFTLFPKPTVGALNGHTFAGGMFMAAHLDFRFMREDRGWICLPEVDINIPLLPGMIAICQAIMPPRSFHHLYYTGKRFSGPEALEMGIVSELHAEEKLLPACTAFAAQLAMKSPRTYGEMKKRIRSEVARLLEEEDPKYFQSTLAVAMGG